MKNPYTLRAGRQWTSLGAAARAVRHGNDELLGRQHIREADDLHFDEPGLLAGPHHLGLLQVLRPLGTDGPQDTVRLQSRDERPQAAQIVPVAEEREDHVHRLVAARADHRAPRAEFVHEPAIAFDAEHEDLGAGLDPELLNPAACADELLALRRRLHRPAACALEVLAVHHASLIFPSCVFCLPSCRAACICSWAARARRPRPSMARARSSSDRRATRASTRDASRTELASRTRTPALVNRTCTRRRSFASLSRTT